ncbi:Cytochrome P450 [Penicillium mononematosum]|uniref:Cytochrome P450 n=1 Tax=Penicillium mononematosum TaxID=268346 RepID=UPI002549B83B|nr:Cytochrome P450 [Penicillium mononematosum]KAJ6189376.1 Cytochrome P450 [Penicillium mononematosum]
MDSGQPLMRVWRYASMRQRTQLPDSLFYYMDEALDYQGQGYEYGTWMNDKSLLQPRANGSKLDEKKEFHEWRVPKNTPVNDP